MTLLFVVRRPHYTSIPICCQKVAVATLGLKNNDGLYIEYCPLLLFKVSGRKCRLITTNLLGGHDVENKFIRLVHAITTDAREVADRTIDIVVDDTLHRGNTAVLHGKHR